MLAAVKEVSNCDIFISVAAVADYRPQTYQPQKIKKANQPLTLELVPNPDFFRRGSRKPPFCVGFAAETEKLDQYAQKKRQQKRLPLIVANLAQQAMGADESTLILFDDDGNMFYPRPQKPNSPASSLNISHNYLKNKMPESLHDFARHS